MKKWIYLSLVTLALFAMEFVIPELLHPTFRLTVIFFATQVFVLFRLENWAPKEWAIQVSLVKIIIRLLSSMIFILVLVYTQDDLHRMVIQFIAIYLVYMIFEIVIALTNLRRN